MVNSMKNKNNWKTLKMRYIYDNKQPTAIDIYATTIEEKPKRIRRRELEHTSIPENENILNLMIPYALDYLNEHISLDMKNEDLFYLLMDMYKIEFMLRNGIRLRLQELTKINIPQYLASRLSIHISLTHSLYLTEEKLDIMISPHIEELKVKLINSIIQEKEL